MPRISKFKMFNENSIFSKLSDLFKSDRKQPEEKRTAVTLMNEHYIWAYIVDDYTYKFYYIPGCEIVNNKPRGLLTNKRLVGRIFKALDEWGNPTLKLYAYVYDTEVRNKEDMKIKFMKTGTLKFLHKQWNVLMEDGKSMKVPQYVQIPNELDGKSVQFNNTGGRLNSLKHNGVQLIVKKLDFDDKIVAELMGQPVQPYKLLAKMSPKADDLLGTFLDYWILNTIPGRRREKYLNLPEEERNPKIEPSKLILSAEEKHRESLLRKK